MYTTRLKATEGKSLQLLLAPSTPVPLMATRLLHMETHNLQWQGNMGKTQKLISSQRLLLLQINPTQVRGKDSTHLQLADYRKMQINNLSNSKMLVIMS